jgi:hypothetical protein
MSPPKDSPPKKKMLILRGNSDTEGKQYPDEQGKLVPWPNGALHEKAALAYAACRGRDGEVLPVSGDPLKDGDRDKNPQTMQALRKLQDPDHPHDYDAIYGFSGGGYDVRHILNQLTVEQRKDIKLVVVLGAPPVGKDNKPQKEDFLPEKFGLPKKSWELVYHVNQDAGEFPTPNKVGGKHMYLPEFLLAKEKCTQKSP